MTLLNKYTLLSLFLFVFSSFSALGGNLPVKQEKEDKKCTQKKILSKNHKLPSLDKKQRASTKKIAIRVPLESYLENIPPDILHEICYQLDPVDTIHLSQTSRVFYKMITEKFWEKYIKYHNQKSWDKVTPSIKVAVAYSLFRDGEIKKAAKLGFPKALKAVKEKESLKYMDSADYGSKKSSSKNQKQLQTIPPILPHAAYLYSAQ